MTTKVTIETHDWPAAVSISDIHSYKNSQREVHSSAYTHEFIPAHAKREYLLTDSRSLRFRELPKDATGLDLATNSAQAEPIPAATNSAEEE
jgi:hypothetical protein